MKKLILILFLLSGALFTAANAQTTVNIQTSAIKVPTEKAAALRDAICYEHGYQDLVPDQNGNMVTNPVTKAQYAQLVIDARFEEWLKNLYRSHVQKEAVKTVDDDLGVTKN